MARNLLRDDGVIFVSIDDNEVHNLRLLMNEIFGEENFVSNIVWKKKTGAGSSIQHVFDEHEYVLVYAKNKSIMPRWRLSSEEEGNFQNPDNDERGNWESCALTAPSKNRNPNQLFMIEVHFNSPNMEVMETDRDGRQCLESFNYLGHKVILREVLDTDDPNFTNYEPDKNTAKFIRRWAYTKHSIRQIFDQRKVYFKDGNIPRFKKFESEYEGKALRSIYYDEFSTQQGTDPLKEFFGESLVEYPKPIELIKHLANAATSGEDMILDFFAGSCTTAHAVLVLNKEAVEKRKFLMVQLPEQCDEKSDAFKADYKTISEIGKERIRRSIKKIHAESDQLNFKDKSMDLGFKVFNLVESNFKQWQQTEITDSDQLEKNMKLFVDPVRKGSSADNMLYELLLKSGKDLNSRIEHINNYYLVNENELSLLLEEANQSIIEEIIRLKPQKVIALDKLFEGNDQLKTNTVLQMKDAEIDFKTI